MTTITLFSSPKSFRDPHIATIQRNAIASWTHLPGVEVLLIGQDWGVLEAAKELGVNHLPEVKCSSNGTPLISSMLKLARENSESDMLCIINTDVILLPDFIEVAKQVQLQVTKFVLLSQRWDLDVMSPLDFTEDWAKRMRSAARGQGELHRPAGSDFFLFPRACYAEVPDFTIGRAGWDNWMIYKARQEKWPVIDATPSLTIVHQNHDYRHLPEGKTHHTHPESNENIRLAGGQATIRFTILDATHCLVNGKLTRPAFSSKRFWRGVEVFLRKFFSFLPENAQENIVRPRRWKKRIQKLFRNRNA